MIYTHVLNIREAGAFGVPLTSCDVRGRGRLYRSGYSLFSPVT
jgi:hypothetical protein